MEHRRAGRGQLRLLTAIDAYLARHPGTTRQHLLDAQHNAAVAREPG